MAMGIDHVGKKGPPAGPPPETVGVDRPAEAGKSFEIAHKSTVSPADVRVPIEAPSTALDRFRAGEVDVEGYLDLKVTEATEHLAASLPAEMLEEIRNALRERLATDPTLSELARIAMGHVPEPGGQE
jgi:hypothetical protein